MSRIFIRRQDQSLAFNQYVLHFDIFKQSGLFKWLVWPVYSGELSRASWLSSLNII